MMYKVVFAAGLVMCLMALAGAEGSASFPICMTAGAVGAVAMVYGLKKMDLFD